MDVDSTCVRIWVPNCVRTLLYANGWFLGADLRKSGYLREAMKVVSSGSTGIKCDPICYKAPR